MAITIDEMKNLQLYKQGIYMPVNDNDRKNGSLMYLMAPSLKDSKGLLNEMYTYGGRHHSFVGLNNWSSYYMEKDITFYLNQEQHTLSLMSDQLLLEDGEIVSKPKIKGTLSEFNRVDISRESLDEFIVNYEEVQGIVEYFPWTGYFYINEADQLIAGINVNVDDRTIQKIFVTEDKYSYLYKELIEEARKLKGNIIICNKNDKCLKYLEEFGFSIVEDVGENLKLQFKVPIEESVKFYNTNHELVNYMKSDKKYKIKSDYDKDVTSALLEAVAFYMDRLHLNHSIGFVMARCLVLENGMDLIQRDIQLRKWLNESDLAMAYVAISDTLLMAQPQTIYSNVLRDCNLMIHHIDLDVIIRDAVNWYFDEYELIERDWLYDEEVPIIEDRINSIYHKNSINDWGLRISYDYYRARRGKLMSGLKKKMDMKIRMMYRVRRIESPQNEAAQLVMEANASFGYDNEIFSSAPEDWKEVMKLNNQRISPRVGFCNSGIVLNDSPIIDSDGNYQSKVNHMTIKNGDRILGALQITPDRTIDGIYSEDIDVNYLITIAGRKFHANKAIIPEECTSIIEAFDNNREWNLVYHDKGKAYYEASEGMDVMTYPHVEISEEEKSLFSRLDEDAKKFFLSNYLDDFCVSNTIYRKVYEDVGIVNLYTMPEFPKIAYVNIALLKEQRHKGFASKMLEETVSLIKSQYDCIKALGWCCDISNADSYNLAIRFGFKPYASKGNHVTLMKYIHDTPLQMPVFTEDYHEEDTWDAKLVENLDGVSNLDGVYTLLQEEADKKMSSNTSSKFKQILWDDRIKNDKKILGIYEEVKQETDGRIKHTYLKLDQYKGCNLIFDVSYYIESFLNNYNKAFHSTNTYECQKFFFNFIKRLLKQDGLSQYKKVTCMVPLHKWQQAVSSPTDVVQNVLLPNTLVVIARKSPELLKALSNIDFVFYNGNEFFKVNFSEDDIDHVKLKNLMFKVATREKNKLVRRQVQHTKKAIVHQILDDLEVKSGNSIKIQSITKDSKESPEKKEMVEKIEKAADKANNPDDALEELDKEDAKKVEELMDKINDEEPGNVKISAARSKRLNKLCQDFLNQKVDKTTMGTFMEYNHYNEELPERALPIESINEDWQHLQYDNFERVYNLHADIYQILYFLSHCSMPLVIYDKIDIQDVSTSEDWIETWTVPFEDDVGKRFKFKFDLPLLKDNRYMILGGNDKTINGQLVLLPISKTEDDTVQIVSNYNKIFIRRYSNGICKATRNTDFFAKFIEIMAKEHPQVVSVKYGNSSSANNKYSLPFDYVDISETYFTIRVKAKEKNVGDLVLYFNQLEARKELKLDPDDDKFMVLGYIEEGSKRSPIYFDLDTYSTCGGQLIDYVKKWLEGTKYFEEYFNKLKPSTKYCYSKASILGTEIPVIIIMAFSEGLQTALKKAHINFEVYDKRVDSLKWTHDCIRFSDAYLYYEDTYNASMLMNGLKEVDTRQFSFKDIDSKMMWTVFLDDYGGRIKADGLDNFYDLMIDPITREVCIDYKLPTDYCELLAYANILLADNEYIKHTNLESNRFRTNELIAAKAYKCIATAYSSYKIQRRKERSGVTMTMKQSAIIDALLTESTMSDMSFNNPLGEIESKNAVSFKGHVGLNSDRSYGIDKRNYDPSMINKIALSTGFAGNVGVNRQTTINMAIKGTRGYMKNTDVKDASAANTLSMTEALTPFGSTRDDPFRTAMTNIQTSKHNMRVNHTDPLLVTCGADQAIAYLTGDSFAFKAKGSGKVVKANKDYLIVEYDEITEFDPTTGKQLPHKDNVREIVDLRSLIKKNSDGGFYITVKLDSDYKVGQRFKKDDILAYDKQVYSNTAGDGKHITYNVGPLANIAYINTDEGFEDSAIISDRLANCLSSEVVVMISKNLPGNTNIFSMVSKGTPVQEGDTLMLYQNPFDEEDANTIVRNLSMDKEEVSAMGRIPVKSKVTGVVEDIKIYRTIDYSEMSPSLKKIVKAYEDKLEPLHQDSKKVSNKIDLDANYKLDPVSKMKNCEGKVKIEFYLKYNDKMGVGDKLVFFSAIKGETKTIFPIGQEPYTDRRPDEMIDSLCPLPSVLHRMVASVKILTGLYKGIIELTRYMKECIGLKYEPYNKRI